MALKIGFTFVPMPQEIWDLCLDLTQGEFRLLGYIIRHTIGFRNSEIKLTDDEIINGRRTRDDNRIDRGCGLSVNTMKDARDKLIERGYITFIDGYYTPVLETGQEKELSKVDSQLSKVDTPHYIRERQCIKTYTSDFDEWWLAVPKKEGKPAAKKAYLARREEGVTREVLLQGIIAYANKCRVEKTESKYIKHPQGWLNRDEERWLADYTPSKKAGFKSTYDIAADERRWMDQKRRQNASKPENLIADLAKHLRTG